MSETTLYLIRNTTTLPAEGEDNKDWSLSKLGQQQAENMVVTLSTLNINAIATSPWQRAKDTIAPFAKAENIPVVEAENLKDQLMALETLPPADFQKLTQAMWAEERYAEPECESNSKCQERITKAMQQIVDDHPQSRVLVSTHGQIIALFLNGLDKTFGYADWANMPMPCIYKVVYNGDNFRWDSKFELPST